MIEGGLHSRWQHRASLGSRCDAPCKGTLNSRLRPNAAVWAQKVDELARSQPTPDARPAWEPPWPPPEAPQHKAPLVPDVASCFAQQQHQQQQPGHPRLQASCSSLPRIDWKQRWQEQSQVFCQPALSLDMTAASAVVGSCLRSKASASGEAAALQGSSLSGVDVHAATDQQPALSLAQLQAQLPGCMRQLPVRELLSLLEALAALSVAHPGTQLSAFCKELSSEAFLAAAAKARAWTHDQIITLVTLLAAQGVRPDAPHQLHTLMQRAAAAWPAAVSAPAVQGDAGAAPMQTASVSVAPPEAEAVAGLPTMPHHQGPHQQASSQPQQLLRLVVSLGALNLVPSWHSTRWLLKLSQEYLDQQVVGTSAASHGSWLKGLLSFQELVDLMGAFVIGLGRVPDPEWQHSWCLAVAAAAPSASPEDLLLFLQLLVALPGGDVMRTTVEHPGLWGSASAGLWGAAFAAGGSIKDSEQHGRPSAPTSTELPKTPGTPAVEHALGTSPGQSGSLPEPGLALALLRAAGRLQQRHRVTPPSEWVQALQVHVAEHLLAVPLQGTMPTSAQGHLRLQAQPAYSGSPWPQADVAPAILHLLKASLQLRVSLPLKYRVAAAQVLLPAVPQLSAGQVSVLSQVLASLTQGSYAGGTGLPPSLGAAVYEALLARKQALLQHSSSKQDSIMSGSQQGSDVGSGPPLQPSLLGGPALQPPVDAAEYASWLRGLAEGGSNVVHSSPIMRAGFRDVLVASVTPDLLATGTPVDMVNIAWGLARLQCRPPSSWFHALLQASGPRALATLPPKQLAILAWSLARLGAGPHLPPAWLRRLYCCTARSMASLAPRYVSQLAWAIATLQQQAVAAALQGGPQASSALSSAAAAAAAAADLDQQDVQPATPLAATPSATAMGSTNSTATGPGPAWIGRLLSVSEGMFRQADAHTLSNLAWAVSRLALASPFSHHSISDHTGEDGPEQEGTASQAIHAWGRVHAALAPWTSSLRTALKARAHVADTHSLAIGLWSIAQLESARHVDGSDYRAGAEGPSASRDTHSSGEDVQAWALHMASHLHARLSADASHQGDGSRGSASPSPAPPQVASRTTQDLATASSALALLGVRPGPQWVNIHLHTSAQVVSQALRAAASSSRASDAGEHLGVIMISTAAMLGSNSSGTAGPGYQISTGSGSLQLGPVLSAVAQVCQTVPAANPRALVAITQALVRLRVNLAVTPAAPSIGVAPNAAPSTTARHDGISRPSLPDTSLSTPSNTTSQQHVDSHHQQRRVGALTELQGALLMASHRRLGAMSLRELTLLAWGFTRLGIKPPAKWLSRFQAAVWEAGQQSGIPPRTSALLLWAAAKGGWVLDAELLRALLPGRHAMALASPGDLAQIAWGLSTMRLRPSNPWITAALLTSARFLPMSLQGLDDSTEATGVGSSGLAYESNALTAAETTSRTRSAAGTSAPRPLPSLAWPQVCISAPDANRLMQGLLTWKVKPPAWWLTGWLAVMAAGAGRQLPATTVRGHASGNASDINSSSDRPVDENNRADPSHTHLLDIEGVSLALRAMAALRGPLLDAFQCGTLPAADSGSSGESNSSSNDSSEAGAGAGVNAALQATGTAAFAALLQRATQLLQRSAGLNSGNRGVPVSAAQQANGSVPVHVLTPLLWSLATLGSAEAGRLKQSQHAQGLDMHMARSSSDQGQVAEAAGVRATRGGGRSKRSSVSTSRGTASAQLLSSHVRSVGPLSAVGPDILHHFLDAFWAASMPVLDRLPPRSLVVMALSAARLEHHAAAIGMLPAAAVHQRLHDTKVLAGQQEDRASAGRLVPEGWRAAVAHAIDVQWAAMDVSQKACAKAALSQLMPEGSPAVTNSAGHLGL